MRSRFLQGAKADLAEDVEYYDLATSGLGDRFLAEVQTAVDFLESFLQGARTISGDIRAKGLARFRHTLLYVVAKNEVVILAVAHQRQDLQAWLEIVRSRRSGV